MTDFIIKKPPYDLTSIAGLALVGQHMNRLSISDRVDQKFPVGVAGIANSDILKSYLGLLVQGKNDFDAIEEFRGDSFFTRALDVSTVNTDCGVFERRRYGLAWQNVAHWCSRRLDFIFDRLVFMT